MLLAVTSAVSSPSFAQPEPIDVVFRVDARPPSEVFEHGLFGVGGAIGVLGHVLEGRCNATTPRSAWVSTTASRSEATRFALRRLENAGASGTDHKFWLYEIRPDSSFISVPGVVRQAIDAAERGVGGYVPAHAQRIRFLMSRSAIGLHEEVVTRRVLPSNIVRATPVWRGITTGMLVPGPVFPNPAYVAAQTRAAETVDDLATYVPISSIGTSAAADAPSCLMSCDRATSASRRSVGLDADTEGFCAAYRESAMTPEKFQILID